MKIQVLRDSKGAIIASIERTPGARVHVTPEAEKGQKLEEMDVSEDYAEKPDELYKKRP